MKVSWVLSDDERNRFKFNVHFVGENKKKFLIFSFLSIFSGGLISSTRLGQGKVEHSSNLRNNLFYPLPDPLLNYIWDSL